MDCMMVQQLIGPMSDAQLTQELDYSITLHCLTCPQCSHCECACVRVRVGSHDHA